MAGLWYLRVCLYTGLNLKLKLVVWIKENVVSMHQCWCAERQIFLVVETDSEGGVSGFKLQPADDSGKPTGKTKKSSCQCPNYFLELKNYLLNCWLIK